LKLLYVDLLGTLFLIFRWLWWVVNKLFIL
jgi:hypothetical protein